MRIALMVTETIISLPVIVDVLEQHKKDIDVVVLRKPSIKPAVAWKLVRERSLSFAIYWLLKTTLLPWLQKLCRRSDQLCFNSVEHACAAHNIPCITTEDVNHTSLHSALKNYQPDLLAMVEFDQVLTDTTRELASVGVVNFHASALPRCRGLFPVLHTYLYNQRQFGLSAHWVDSSAINDGPLIAKRDIRHLKESTLLELEQAMYSNFSWFFDEVIHQIKTGNRIPFSQHNASSYYGYPSRKDLQKLRRMGLRLFSWRWVIKQLQQAREDAQRKIHYAGR